MDAVWVDELYIGTAESSGTWTYAKLCEGILGMSFSENEQNQQNFFLCGQGFADNDVTGAAPELVITGKRKVGNTAQDFIAGLQFTVGSARRSSVKVVSGGNTIVCGCTIGNITSFGGNTLDQNAFGCTIRFNGKPTVTPVSG